MSQKTYLWYINLKQLKLEFEGGVIVEDEIVTGSRNLREKLFYSFKTVR
jgi:hypothetical protein